MVTGSLVGCRFEGGGNRPKQSEPLPNPSSATCLGVKKAEEATEEETEDQEIVGKRAIRFHYPSHRSSNFDVARNAQIYINLSAVVSLAALSCEAGSEEERWYLQFKRTSGNPTVRPSARGGPALERVGSSQSRGCKGKRGQSHGEHPAVQTPKCETWGQEESNRIMHRVFALRESLMITLESSC
ncbi:hypothetical protein G5I_07456 [Acromyrmex echinatior]|uniref:Uncharacterized protein n=1 Tax=Acromyrmex echinatior TaxID=103372 RepID=F4WNU9_ACREC|nr:hypothetical protein G5I_07456 [Acromyrmex echinatior]